MKLSEIGEGRGESGGKEFSRIRMGVGEGGEKVDGCRRDPR